MGREDEFKKIETDVAMGRELVGRLVEAGLVAPATVRVIIDAHCDYPLTVYAQHFRGGATADIVFDAMLAIRKAKQKPETADADNPDSSN